MGPVEELTECSVLWKLSFKPSDPRSPLDPRPLVVHNAARCSSSGQQHGQGWWQVFFPHRLWMGLRHNGSGTEANLSRRACLLPRAVCRHSRRAPESRGPCPGPGTTTWPRGCDRDPDPDRPPSQELHPVCPCADIFTGRAGGCEGTPSAYVFICVLFHLHNGSITEG